MPRATKLDCFAILRGIVREDNKTLAMLRRAAKRFPDEGYCDVCGGYHGAEGCQGPHYAVCYCVRCRGVDYQTWARKPKNYTPKDEQPMITVTRNNPTQGASTPKGIQFLSPRHITNPEGHTATITKVTTDKPDNFGNPYVVYFVMDGQKYSKGYKPTSDALSTLVDLFGADEKKWIKRTVVIGKMVDDDGGERLTYKAK